jgi:hypothetical protein
MARQHLGLLLATSEHATTVEHSLGIPLLPKDKEGRRPVHAGRRGSAPPVRGRLPARAGAEEGLESDCATSRPGAPVAPSRSRAARPPASLARGTQGRATSSSASGKGRKTVERGHGL